MKKTKVIVFIILIISLINSKVLALSDAEYNERYQRAKELTRSVNAYQASNDLESDKTVYVTDNDSKYHVIGCDSMKSSPIKTNLEKAEEYGYSPCKRCNPYGRATSFYGGEKNHHYNLIGWIMFVVAYMVVPIVLKIQKSVWKSKKELRIFLILNSIGASLLFLIIFLLGGYLYIEYFFSIALIGLIFYLINYFILKKNINSPIPTTKINGE